MLKRVRDYAQVRGDGKITREIASEGLSMLDVDELGLDRVDRTLLTTMIDKFGGGPVGWIHWPRLQVRTPIPLRMCTSRIFYS